MNGRLLWFSTSYYTKVGTTPVHVRHTLPGAKAHSVIVKRPNVTKPCPNSQNILKGENWVGGVEFVAWEWVYEAAVAKMFAVTHTLDLQTYIVMDRA